MTTTWLESVEAGAPTQSQAPVPQGRGNRAPGRGVDHRGRLARRRGVGPRDRGPPTRRLPRATGIGPALGAGVDRVLRSGEAGALTRPPGLEAPMTAGSIVPTLPVPLLRDGLGREAASLSLRRVAREAGLSPNGVRDFLQGAIPRSATRVKLERWLATRGKVTRPPNVGQFVRLLNELSVDISPAQTLELGRALAELLVHSYEVRRLSPPRWVQDLLRHYRPRRGKAASEVA